MLAAIEFNDQASLKADEINNIVTDRRLPAKSAPVEIAPAKFIPERALGIGQVPAQVPCEVAIAFHHDEPLPNAPVWKLRLPS
jgi:hypothetical protein